jgi:flagellar biosynthesis protein FlhF
MNVKRFTARTSRDALALVRQAFGDDAVVMSTRPCADGVEVVAMAGDSVQQLERVGAAQVLAEPRGLDKLLARAAARGTPLTGAERGTPLSAAAREQLPPVAREAAARAPDTSQQSASRFADGHKTPGGRVDPTLHTAVEDDVAQLQMSTLSFQDYVRERMLKRRDAERAALAATQAPKVQPSKPSLIDAARNRLNTQPRDNAAMAALMAHNVPVLRDEVLPEQLPARARPANRQATAQPAAEAARPAVPQIAPRLAAAMAAPVAPVAPAQAPVEMMSELRSMRGLIEQRFGALAFMDKLQRQPRQAQLAQRLLESGFSPVLIRKLVDSMPSDVDEMVWASGVLEHNLLTAERESPLEDVGGIYAMIGATGVGKTTSTAKLAAAFATKHGATNLGLITLDAYRVGAHEQLRTYGRILGVPVHTAHDRASLEDLLDLLSAKRMVLIDTAGMAQRDSRTRELLDMVSHRSINRLLVVNASAQGETIEDQLVAYAAQGCKGILLSKLDEAVKLAPALDAMVRHKLKVLAVANGQRVPEDWHRLSAHALVQRALKTSGGAAWKLNDNDVNLIFAGLPQGLQAKAQTQAQTPVAEPRAQRVPGKTGRAALAAAHA